MTKFAFVRKAGRFARARNRFREDKRCIWCHVQTRRIGKYPRPTDATREHLRPRSMGGGGAANLATACRACNNMRGSDDDWVPWKLQANASPGSAYRRRDGVLLTRRMHMGVAQTPWEPVQ